MLTKADRRRWTAAALLAGAARRGARRLSGGSTTAAPVGRRTGRGVRAVRAERPRALQRLLGRRSACYAGSERSRPLRDERA